MKRWEKVYFSFCFLIFLVICAILLVLFWRGKDLSNAKDVYELARILLMIYVFMIPIYFGLNAIIIIKNGLRNIKNVEDPLFKKIEKYGHCWRESNGRYITQIQIINLYYKSEGKVDELVKKKEIERLYTRYHFLSTRCSLFDHVSVGLN